MTKELDLIALVRSQIIEHSEFLKLEDHLDGAEHVKTVKKGKVLLKMLSTLGRPEVFTWLKHAETNGNFYDYSRYSIVKKTTYQKDLVNFNEVKSILDTTMKYMGENVDVNSQNLSDIIQKMKLKNKGYDPRKLDLIVPALGMLVGKITNILHRPKLHIGEIYNRYDRSVNFTDLDLVTIYMEQEGLDNEEEAIEQLSSSEVFNITGNIFDEFKIDKRTNWSNCHRLPPEFDIENNDAGVIAFWNKDYLEGKVYINSDGVIKPETYWSKNRDFPGVALNVPFPNPIPLWNADRIKTHKDSIVILLDSLCGAHKSYSQSLNEINRLEDELHELQQYDPKRYLGHEDTDFEDELKNSIYEKLLNQGSLNKEVFDKEYAKARVINRLNGFYFNFTQDNIKCNNSDDDQVFDKRLYICLPHLDINKSKEDNYTNLKFFFGLNKKFLVPGGNGLQEDPKAAIQASFKGILLDDNTFLLFKQIYAFMKEEISRLKQNDRNKIKEIEERLASLNKVIWTSWYGGEYTLWDVKWGSLRNRNIYYVIRSTDKRSYEIAIKIYLNIMNVKPSKIVFVDYEKLINGDDSSTDVHQFIMAPEDLLQVAEDKYGLNKKSILKTSVKHHEEIEEAPRTYIPQKSEKTIDDRFILKPLIRENSITLLYSEPGVGKSWLSLSMAYAVLYGVPVFFPKFAWEAPEPRRVLFIDSEMSEQGLEKRLHILNESYASLQKNSTSPYPFKYYQTAKGSWDLTDEEGRDRDKITRWLNLRKKDKIDLLILDNLSTLSGFKDSGKSWKNLFDWLQSLREQGCSSLVVHHANKVGDQRGSSIKSATVDNIIRVKKILPGMKKGIGLSIDIEKARDGEGDAQIPFNVLLNFSRKGGAKWEQTYPYGKKNIDIQERNNLIIKLWKTRAFSQTVIANYLGVDAQVVKRIINQSK